MPDKIFFQCSLPRTGSTLFQNLINQDPRFYASANNGLLDMVSAANVNYTNGLEFKAQDPDLMSRAFHGFCKGAMHGFYNAITDRQYALDKSRGNFCNYEMVNNYYPDAKMVCFVRNMPDIFASIEKLFRRNQHKADRIVNNTAMQGTSTPKRVDIWHRSFEQMMRFWATVVETGNDKKILFIKYESFCQNPEAELRRFYRHVGIPVYRHDITNIPQTVHENEEVYGYTGMLKIRNAVGRRPSDAKEVLGADVYAGVMNVYSAYNSYFGYS
jgi:sulfotransferase